MHFRSYIRSMIPHDAAILYAVLAISTKHRELMTGLKGIEEADEYERKCLEVLIPSLNDTDRALQDAALASALLLRLFEEMSVPIEQQTMSSHAVSAPILMQIKQGNIRSSGFSDAAMIVALRQEIFIANMTKQPVQPIIGYCSIDETLQPASDAMWAYRMIAHAARVTTFVHSTGGHDAEEWAKLWEYLRDWDRCKPDSFIPMYQSSTTRSPEPSTGEASSFPRIYYTYDCPAAAQQYLQICRILLMGCIPPTCTLYSDEEAECPGSREDKIREAVRIICGISISNPEYVPARLTAGLAVALCGQHFTCPSETKELLRIVSEAELHLGWPCLKVSLTLRDIWGLHEFTLDKMAE
ncbi:hypothetical protein N8I77_013220 [Diaporthe amygdali]|uniref:Uncharacterized protein n=1 Tax=Phomopsis amygdali TaxID=1214568 RepID=A0AAD9S127_PHOAM|nr:hypothetical protein N8I77_013220 [Diaporthe amygdali]